MSNKTTQETAEVQDNDVFDINTARFARVQDSVLRIQTWSKERIWSVRTEETRHRVVVTWVDYRRWHVHMMIAGGVGLALMLIVLVAGMPFIYALPIAVVVGLVLWGLLKFEQYLMGSDVMAEKMVEVDTPVWMAAQAQIRLLMSQHKKSVEKLKNKNNIPSGNVLDDTELFIKTDRVMSVDSLINYENKLDAIYEDDPSQAVRVGWGVRNCGCRACLFVENTPGVEFKEAGVAVASRDTNSERRSLVLKSKALSKNVETAVKRSEKRKRSEMARAERNVKNQEKEREKEAKLLARQQYKEMKARSRAEKKAAKKGVRQPVQPVRVSERAEEVRQNPDRSQAHESTVVDE